VSAVGFRTDQVRQRDQHTKEPAERNGDADPHQHVPEAGDAPLLPERVQVERATERLVDPADGEERIEDPRASS